MSFLMISTPTLKLGMTTGRKDTPKMPPNHLPQNNQLSLEHPDLYPGIHKLRCYLTFLHQEQTKSVIADSFQWVAIVVDHHNLLNDVIKSISWLLAGIQKVQVDLSVLLRTQLKLYL